MKNTIQINNLNISKRESYFGAYFIIYDNDNQQAYFVFKNKLTNQNSWEELETKADAISEIWLEYETNPKGKQVKNLEIINQTEDIF